MLNERSQGSITVVYIEADRSNALLMQYLLDSRSNYTMHHATNGISGLELCERVNPDLVITETHLPDVTGHEVLRALRSYPGTESVPCIVLSSDAMPASIEKALDSGFDGYWTKPVDIWNLMQSIDDVATRGTLSRTRRFSKKASSKI